MNAKNDVASAELAELTERRLRERLLLGRVVPDDYLMLADATLLAALDGSQPLSANERAALTRSPLTLRRLRQLSNERRMARILARTSASANATSWQRSAGMLRAAASSATLDRLSTDDRCWTLDFLHGGQSVGENVGEGWSVILALAADAPFAAALMREQPLLRVLDGAGAVVLQGRLDADGECEHGWPFDTPPAQHFPLSGGAFSVEVAAP